MRYGNEVRIGNGTIYQAEMRYGDEVRIGEEVKTGNETRRQDVMGY